MLYQTTNPHGGDVYGAKIDYDFSSNTNPFGTPPGVTDAIRQVLGEVHHYPDPFCRQLVHAIAEKEQLPEKDIICGNGAAELIYSYCEALQPETAVELAPTFSEYSLGLERVGCKVSRYPLSQERQFALEEAFLPYLRRERPDVVFLCNPNNPTGMTIDPQLLRAIADLCKELQIKLFLDECFLDLADRGESLKGLLATNRQLFILKAFTKNYAMAGIRLGYGLSSDETLLSQMSQTVQPWNVSLLAQAAGVAALQERAFLQKTKNFIPVEREWLKKKLEELGIRAFESHANYLLLKGPEHLDRQLLLRHVSIRNCDNYQGLGPGWYRVAVRLREENEMLLSSLRQALEKETSWQKIS